MPKAVALAPKAAEVAELRRADGTLTLTTVLAVRLAAPAAAAAQHQGYNLDDWAQKVKDILGAVRFLTVALLGPLLETRPAAAAAVPAALDRVSTTKH